MRILGLGTSVTSGFRTVKAGANAARPSADEIIATSEWPTLNILSTGRFSPSDTVIYEHNLGYFSPFMIFTPPYDYNTFTATTDRSKMERGNYSISFISNTREKLLNSGVEGFYILFDYNLEAPFSLDKNIYTPTRNRDDKKGIKILGSKHSSRGIESPNLEDYSINTGGKSITIHINGKAKIDANNQLTTIRHSLGYLPSYMMFQEDGYPGAPPGIRISDALTTADRLTITVRGAQAVIIGDLYYLIMKEPFSASKEFGAL